MRHLPIALVMFAVVSPALAQSPEACMAPAAQIERLIAEKTDTKAADKALRLSKTAKMLCAAGNSHEARLKFQKAFTALGVDAPPEVSQR